MSVTARVRALALVACACAPTSDAARAQGLAEPPLSESTAPPLSLRAAIAQAVSDNAALSLRRADVAPAAARLPAARVLPPPRFEGQIWSWPVTSLNPANVEMYMLMIEQDLPGRGKRDARAELASRELETASAGVSTARLEVAGAVRRAYAGLALARRDILSAREAARALEDLVAVAESTYAAGSGSQAGVVKTLLELTRVRERLAGFEGEEREATARLNTLMNRPPGAAIGPLDAEMPGLGARADRRSAEAHPAVRAARAAVAEAEAAVRVASLERRPDWMAKGGYMLVPGEAGAWTATVGLTWPEAPWSRGQARAAVAEAEGRLKAARAAVAAEAARVELEIAQAAARESAASGRLALLRDVLVPQARHLVEATRLAFETGAASLSEVLEARQVQLEAELDEARAAAALDLARADLDAASGDAWLAGFLPAEQ